MSFFFAESYISGYSELQDEIGCEDSSEISFLISEL